MKRFYLLLLTALMVVTVAAQPKREMRGAWIQCVNGQFQGMGTQAMQQTLTYQLNELQKDGVNTIIFGQGQVPKTGISHIAILSIACNLFPSSTISIEYGCSLYKDFLRYPSASQEFFIYSIGV